MINLCRMIPRLARKVASALVVLCALTLVGACSRAPESEEAMMKAGLDALYTKNDPTAAVGLFRKVLERNPNHYGATFQLAKALERAGKREEARPVWEKMLAMAEAARDTQTAATVRTHLGQSEAGGEAAIQGAMMKAGLDALYTRNEPTAAVGLFRKVLERNPTHYGATFQLAMALDRAGKPAEARPLWEKVLKTAEGEGDKATAETARKRLAQKQ